MDIGFDLRIVYSTMTICVSQDVIINRENFVVKIFLDTMGNAKIMCIINTNAVRDCLSENYLI